MQEINLEQFEMTNESMSKVLGGKQYSTNGAYNATADQWCESDSGTPGADHISVSNCHNLDDDGNYID